MNLLIETDDGDTYTVLENLEDYLDDSKTIMKEIKVTVDYIENDENE